MENLTFDLSARTVRELNQHLHGTPESLAGQHITVLNPDGAHNIAVGINAPVQVTVVGHAGYYAAGMNKFADVTIEGKIEGAGHVRIAGKFKGDVNVQGNVTIEQGAHVTGQIAAATIMVSGEVHGNITASSRGRAWFIWLHHV